MRAGIGPSTWGKMMQVCRAWREICNSDEVALRMVALYTGGLTKGVFCGLFAFSHVEAATFAHTTHCSSRGYVYYLYKAAAIDAALSMGGMTGLADRRKRKRTFAGLPKMCATRVIMSNPYHKRLKLAQWEREDTFHARIMNKS